LFAGLRYDIIFSPRITFFTCFYFFFLAISAWRTLIFFLLDLRKSLILNSHSLIASYNGAKLRRIPIIWVYRILITLIFTFLLILYIQPLRFFAPRGPSLASSIRTTPPDRYFTSIIITTSTTHFSSNTSFLVPWARNIFLFFLLLFAWTCIGILGFGALGDTFYWEEFIRDSFGLEYLFVCVGFFQGGF
jgi:hypothetical protein